MIICAWNHPHSTQRREQKKKGRCAHADVLRTADALLTDQDVMVQKGYGRTLKEASNNYPKEVFDYVMRNKKVMPRMALRYAIEKLPEKLRKEAMKKDW